MSQKVYIVGSGPNGMASAVFMSEKGYDVTVFEASSTPGGGSRTLDLTGTGFLNDVCSAVHPTALASPYFKELGMQEEVDFIIPDVSFAQPLTHNESVYAYRDIEKTAQHLGKDKQRWLNAFSDFADKPANMGELMLKPFLDVSKTKVITPSIRLGLHSMRESVAQGYFKTTDAQALLSGVVAHANVKLPSLSASFVGFSLTGLSQSIGWPIVRGGSQQIINFLQKKLEQNGGRVICDAPIVKKSQLEDADIVFWDTSVRTFLDIYHDELPSSTAKHLQNFKYGNGVAKLDVTMSEPIPWNDQQLHEAGTIHIGGKASDIALAENTVSRNKIPEKPYILASQPSLFDPTRAPKGYHTALFYTHVPAYYDEDPTDLILKRVEEFAPDIRDAILDSHSINAVQLEEYNSNYIGGDISSGANSLGQFFTRPRYSFFPWATAIPHVYMCSSSTYPGPGVHGMNGYNAAKLAYGKENGFVKNK
ncbi:MAG: NAD(P)/FAD-dependent oxidoreductase [Micrococcaceae bacterium]